VTKRKADDSHAEVGLPPEIRELLENFTEKEIETGVVASALLRPRWGGEGMDADLFEDLVESIMEAGGILRGEREAARRTLFDETDDWLLAGTGDKRIQGWVP